jgi:hypothetical protein
MGSHGKHIHGRLNPALYSLLKNQTIRQYYLQLKFMKPSLLICAKMDLWMGTNPNPSKILCTIQICEVTLQETESLERLQEHENPVPILKDFGA